MVAEKYCPKHGPYDASYNTCPYCSGKLKRPPAPKPLNSDDLPTKLEQDQSATRVGIPDDDLRTIIEVGAYNPRKGYPEKSSTDQSQKHEGGKRFLDSNDEEVTDLGKSGTEPDITVLDQGSPGMLGILWVKDGTYRGHIYMIKEGSVVGSHGGDVILDDPKVSNPHAKFTVEEDQFTLWDFGSRNGTFVNGERIRAATLLNENDVIKIGDFTFILKILE